jgi:hypothetical protein
VAKLKVGINGCGRTGRNFLRCWHGHKLSPIEVVAVNDLVGVENVCYCRGGCSLYVFILENVSIFIRELFIIDTFCSVS